jgi:peptide/nickel transport system substrate-binding protein
MCRGPRPQPQPIYRCGRELNYNGYCSAEVDELIERQSIEADAQSARSWRGKLSGSWPKIAPGRSSFYDRRATCWQPHVKGWMVMVNSIFNGWRMEDVWLDK